MSSFVVADRVQETCNAPGLGVVTLLGASPQFQSFSATIGDTNTTTYAIADVIGVNWEVGIGTYSSSGNTLTRTTVLASSNGGAAVNFSSGTQNVWVDYPAEYAVYASNNSSQILGQALISSGVGVAPTWGNINSTVGSPGYYGSFYDTTNQAAASTTVAYVVNIGSTFQSNQVSINSGNQITFLYAGVYNLQYSIQFINTNTGSSNNDNVDVWLRKNGTDVADSNSVYNIPSRKGSTDGANLAVVNYVLSVNAGDYLQLAWAVTNTTISIATLAAASSPTVPRTPGVIVTATPVTQIGIGYYGLTSATSTLIATGSKTLTTNLSATSTAFTVGTRVRVAYSTTPANYMEGVITAFTGTTLTVLVDSLGGSGTFASWTISVAGIQGSNGVTSFSGNSTGLTPSTATTGAISLGGTLNVANGGTNLTSYTIGDIVYASAATTLASLADVATGNAIISGGVGVAPSYGKIGLTTHVSGTLPIANGGTNSTATPTAGGAGYGTGTAHNYTAAGTSGNALISAGASAPAFGNLALGTANTNVSGALTATNGGTGVAGTLTGILYGNGTSAHSVVTAAQMLTGMGVANTTTSGYLSSTDWNTFNGKQAAGSYVTVGGALGTPSSGTLTNCTFPTLNQNTTGTASNITAYTINQSVGTANSPSFPSITTTANLSIQLGGSASIGFYQDATNTAIRTTASGSIYMQNASGAATYGYFNSNGLNGNVQGNVSGSSGSCTGNAATATTATNLLNGTVTSYGSSSFNFSHGQNLKVGLPAANNGAGTGDAYLYLWTSEPAATWTGGGIARNMANTNGSFPRVNTGLWGQFIHFEEGGAISFQIENTSGTRYYPLTLTNGNVSSAGTISGTNITTGGNVTGSSTSCTGNAATVTNGVYNNGGTYSINVTGSSGSCTGNAATASNVIGNGQTWQNVLGSRAKNTTYTNSTGRSIYVSISGQAGVAVQIVVNGIVIGNTNAANTACTFGFIVPSGGTYYWGSASGTVNYWAELR